MNRVTELIGDQLSGKTIICLNIALELIRDHRNVLYIDTDLCMCSNMFDNLIHEQIDDQFQITDLMKKIDICFLNTYQELVFTLDELRLSQTTGQTNYQLLIIDSIVSPLLAECLISTSKESQDLMHERLNLLINLISKLLAGSLTVLITNVTSSHLPRIWSNRCDLILELKKEEINFTNFFKMKTNKRPFDVPRRSPVSSLQSNSSTNGLLNDTQKLEISAANSPPNHINELETTTMNSPAPDELERIFTLTDKGSIHVFD